MPRLSAAQARDRFGAARVGRLATADVDGVPHLVPITFALRDDTVAFAVDDKPKTTTCLRRLANIASNPQVSVLVDHYDEDWRQLWWARADGTAAEVTGSAQRAALVAALAAKYPQYANRTPRGVVVAITVRRWSGWSARDRPDDR